jgi:hypothetical protein
MSPSLSLRGLWFILLFEELAVETLVLVGVYLKSAFLVRQCQLLNPHVPISYRDSWDTISLSSPLINKKTIWFGITSTI